MWTSEAAPASRAASAMCLAPVTWTASELALEHADEVDHRGGSLDRAGDAPGIEDVGADEAQLADLAQWLDEVSEARLARRDADADAAFHQHLADVAADESAAAEHRDQLFRVFQHGAALAPPLGVDKRGKEGSGQ